MKLLLETKQHLAIASQWKLHTVALTTLVCYKEHTLFQHKTKV